MIGGKVRWQWHEISGGNGASQNSLTTQFGLGDATRVEALRIEWPSGTIQVTNNLAADRTWIITEQGERIDITLRSQDVIMGSNALFSVSTSRQGPLHFQWQFNGNDIPDATNVSLSIPQVKSSDAGFYTVTVAQPDRPEPLTSGRALLALAQPPVITEPPVDQSASIGASVHFQVVAESTLPIRYQWRFQDEVLTGATNAALALTNLQPAQDGVYSVDTINAAGVSSSQPVRLEIDTQFTKITSSLLVNPVGASTSCAWADYNNDGHVDLFVSGRDQDAIFQNHGNGAFSRQTISALAATNLNSRGCAWGDFDNDGRLDLFVTSSDSRNRLYRNLGNDEFEIVMQNPPFNGLGSTDGCAWGDLDNDGYLDLFIAGFGPNRSALFQSVSGVLTKVASPRGDGPGCTWRDYDNDGDVGLFLNGFANLLFRNDAGMLRLVESGDYRNLGGNSVSCSWGDFDNDGDLDVFLACAGRLFNLLLVNLGTNGFKPIALTAESGSWGGVWGDYDNDGFLDLFVMQQEGGRNLLYHNDGAGNLVRVASGSVANDGGRSRACSWVDYDNDGFMDLFVANDGQNYLYRNNGNSNCTNS